MKTAVLRLQTAADELHGQHLCRTQLEEALASLPSTGQSQGDQTGKFDQMRKPVFVNTLQRLELGQGAHIFCEAV